MRNYFNKIAQFNFDFNKLCDEYFQTIKKHNLWERKQNVERYKDRYCKSYINFPIGYDENFEIFPFDLPSDRRKFPTKKGFSVDNIVVDYKNSYTEKIVKEITYFLFNVKYPNYKVGAITHCTVDKKSFLSTHTDRDTYPRFMLVIKATSGCFMEFAGERYDIQEIGALYKTMVCVPHAVINESEDLRIVIFFDAHPK